MPRANFHFARHAHLIVGSEVPDIRRFGPHPRDDLRADGVTCCTVRLAAVEGSGAIGAAKLP
jgi:hypothetical protein